MSTVARPAQRMRVTGRSCRRAGSTGEVAQEDADVVEGVADAGADSAGDLGRGPRVGSDVEDDEGEHDPADELFHRSAPFRATETGGLRDRGMSALGLLGSSPMWRGRT